MMFTSFTIGGCPRPCLLQQKVPFHTSQMLHELAYTVLWNSKWHTNCEQKGYEKLL